MSNYTFFIKKDNNTLTFDTSDQNGSIEINGARIEAVSNEISFRLRISDELLERFEELITFLKNDVKNSVEEKQAHTCYNCKESINNFEILTLELEKLYVDFKNLSGGIKEVDDNKKSICIKG